MLYAVFNDSKVLSAYYTFLPHFYDNIVFFFGPHGAVKHYIAG